MPVAAVFLDRDNTLIQNDGDLGDPDQVVLIKGVASAIASLRGLGYKIVVVTNQGGVARGKYSEQDVDAVHQRINDLIKATTGATIDQFYFCPYHPQGKVKKYRREHPWRKPQPGMLLQAAEELNLDLNLCWLVGDQLRDVESAQAADVRAILLHSDAQAKPREDRDEPATTQADGDGEQTPSYWEAPSLIEAVKIIAKQGRSDSGVKIGITTGIGQSIHGRGMAKAAGSKKRGVAATDTPQQDSVVSAPDEHGRQSQSRRPFRPWLIQPADGQEIDPDAQAVQDEPKKKQDKDTQEETPPTPESSKAVAPEITVVDEDQPLPVAVVGSVTSTQRTLSQILQELRNRRAADMDFSYQHTFAIVLQMVTGVCLLGALWMGGSDFEAFVRWIGVGLVLQLATIAMLIFRR